MSKDSHWFMHDYNARRDPKIIRLCRVKGMKGLGIYWSLIEILHEQGGKIGINEISDIAFELREDEVNVLSVIKEFDLFVIQNEYVRNTRVLQSLELKNAKSSINRVNINARWERERLEKETLNNQPFNTDVLPLVLPILYDGNTNKENKENKEKLYIDFWDWYDKKTDSKKCKDKFMKFKIEEIDKIMLVVKKYVALTPDPKFRKNPLTWLNGRCWEDEGLNGAVVAKPQNMSKLSEEKW